MYSLHARKHTSHSHASGLKCKQVWFCIQVSGCKWQTAKGGQRYGTWKKYSNAAQTPITKPKINVVKMKGTQSASLRQGHTILLIGYFNNSKCFKHQNTQWQSVMLSGWWRRSFLGPRVTVIWLIWLHDDLSALDGWR